jgi:hypothetical protein
MTILNQAFVTSLFAEPQQRYIDVAFVPLVTCAALGCHAMFHYRWRLERRQTNRADVGSAPV